MSSIYQENGYQNRQHYLQCMADDYGIPIEEVIIAATILGSNEDFDGLVTTLEDMADRLE